MLTPKEDARKAKLLEELESLESRARARVVREAYELGKQGFAAVRPDKLGEIQRFQSIFGRYIPHLLTSEPSCILLHQRLLDGIFGNPIQTINKSTFEADLKRFKRAIKVLADWPIWAP